MIRSADEWLMSRSCQSAVFSRAVTRCPRTTRASPHTRSVMTGFRLCGIAELAALQVADLGRDSLQCPGRKRERRHEARVAIPGHDLRRDGVWLQAQLCAYILLDARIDSGMRAHRAADATHRDVVGGALDTGPSAIQLGDPAC